MSPQRVLHVLPTRAPSYGGPVRVAEAMARHLPSFGFEVEVFPAEETSAGVAFWPGARQMIALERAVWRADIVHAHGLWTFPTSAAAATARALRKPYVITPHGMLDRWSLNRSRRKKQLWAAIVERRNLKRANALHFFNGEEREEAQAFGAMAPSFLLPNGIELEDFEQLPGRDRLLSSTGLPSSAFVLLFLGRIHPKKGFDVLIPALQGLRTERDVRLVIAGPDEGGYRAEVERMTSPLGARISFVGEVLGDRKRELLGGADAFLLPSHQEGDSIAVKEALASGLPLLISDKCHFPEVATEGAGLVVPDTVDGVRSALETLCSESSPALEERRRRARTLASRFEWSALAARLAEQYRSLQR